MFAAVLAGFAACTATAGAQSPAPGDESAAAVSEPDWNALQDDDLIVSPPGTAAAHRQARSSTDPSGPAMSWSRTEHADGSAGLTVKKPLPLDWDSKLGADFSVAPPPATTLDPIDSASMPGAAPGRSAGAAWASASVPAADLPVVLDKASVEARVDPTRDQGKFGLRASKSLALGKQWSLTLQSACGATQTLPREASGAAMTSIAAENSRVYSAEPSVRLDILATGTSFAAGAIRSSDDGDWRPSLRAEQKLLHDVDIVGSVSETAAGPPDASISARFKRTW